MSKRSVLAWLKLVCLCGVAAALWRGGAGAAGYALPLLLAYAAIEMRQRRDERAALAEFHARPEAAHQWFAANLSGERVADLKAIRARFGLSLRDAVAVLDEYRRQSD